MAEWDTPGDTSWKPDEGTGFTPDNDFTADAGNTFEDAPAGGEGGDDKTCRMCVATSAHIFAFADPYLAATPLSMYVATSAHS